MRVVTISNSIRLYLIWQGEIVIPVSDLSHFQVRSECL